MFNAKQYEGEFTKQVRKLANAESVTKALLLTMSREVLEAIHVTEDIGYVNRLVAALTPINKKVAIEYFKHFSGFSYEEDKGLFGKKDKKTYEGVVVMTKEFLADPLNNIWVWADRNIEVKKAEFHLENVGKLFAQQMKKAVAAGFNQQDVLREVLKQGVEADTLIKLLGDMYDFDVDVKA